MVLQVHILSLNYARRHHLTIHPAHMYAHLLLLRAMCIQNSSFAFQQSNIITHYITRAP